jgi:hypothetical protein
LGMPASESVEFEPGRLRGPFARPADLS